MQSIIDVKAMPESARAAFVRALAKELFRIKDNPALWARIEAKANIRRENHGSVIDGEMRREFPGG